MINNNTNFKYSPKFGAVANPQINPVNYTAAPITANDVGVAVNDNAVVSRAKKAETGGLVIPATILSWFGLCKGMDYVNNNLIAKDYAQTPFGKVGAWGDKISEGYATVLLQNQIWVKKLTDFLIKQEPL